MKGACLISQRQRLLRYDVLKNKKLDVKKLIPKILEEFTIVITWPFQILGSKGSHYAPSFSMSFFKKNDKKS